MQVKSKPFPEGRLGLFWYICSRAVLWGAIAGLISGHLYLVYLYSFAALFYPLAALIYCGVPGLIVGAIIGFVNGLVLGVVSVFAIARLTKHEYLFLVVLFACATTWLVSQLLLPLNPSSGWAISNGEAIGRRTGLEFQTFAICTAMITSFLLGRNVIRHLGKKKHSIDSGVEAES